MRKVQAPSDIEMKNRIIEKLRENYYSFNTLAEELNIPRSIAKDFMLRIHKELNSKLPLAPKGELMGQIEAPNGETYYSLQKSSKGYVTVKIVQIVPRRKR